jgi:hypothetical protein
MEGERVIWEALVGTGRGTRLEGAGQRWDFTTPRGMFRVLRKEKDPVWNVPDWAFVMRGEPIPPRGLAARREEGDARHHRALHGGGHRHPRHQPSELLGPARVRRLHPHDQRDGSLLYHEVEVGTPVIIY